MTGVNYRWHLLGIAETPRLAEAGPLSPEWPPAALLQATTRSVMWDGGVTLGLQKQSVADVVTRGGRFFPACGAEWVLKGCVRGFLSREVRIQGRPTIILFPSSFRAPQLAPLTLPPKPGARVPVFSAHSFSSP